MILVKDIYDLLDKIAPFSLQESYDNSGLIVGSKEKKAKKILVALDITKKTAQEAVYKQCNLVISHHPVIFNGLKNLDFENPAVILAKNNISAICLHTNFDIAKGGMNDILCKRLGLAPKETLAVDNGVEIGYVCDNPDKLTPKQLAQKVKLLLGNRVVRYVDTKKELKKIAVCSGSGGGFLSSVIQKNIDAYVTGDIKHDVFIEAYNREICLVDAGHYYTENIFFDVLKQKLLEKYPELEVIEADSNIDVVSYEI